MLFRSWEPKTKFKELVQLMVDADVKELRERMSGKVEHVNAEGH